MVRAEQGVGEAPGPGAVKDFLRRGPFGGDQSLVCITVSAATEQRQRGALPVPCATLHVAQLLRMEDASILHRRTEVTERLGTGGTRRAPVYGRFPDSIRSANGRTVPGQAWGGVG